MSVKNIEDIEASIGSESSTIMKNRFRSIIKSLFLCCFGYCGILYLYRYLCGWYKSFKDKKLKKQPENNGSGGAIKIKGLNNLGNTCFFNSMLQCVIHTVPLHNLLSRIITGMDYIVESNIGGPIQVTGPASTGQFTMTLQQFLDEVNTRQDRVISPWNVLNALSRENTRFAHRTQEDSHEALRCLLSAVRNDEITGIKAAIYSYYGVTADPASHSNLDGESKLCMKEYLANASKGASVVDQLIGTTLISTTICHQCLTPAQIVELCLDLSLPMSSYEDNKTHVSCVDDQNKSKRRSKRHNSVRKEHIMTATPCATDLPVNAMPAKSTDTDNSSDEEPTEFLNGYFDATIMHLYTYHDDPSSSEEEQSDNEDVLVKEHTNGETLKSNMMMNHSSQLNARKHNDYTEVSSVEDAEIDAEEEQHGENNIAFSNYELNLYLKDKGLLCQVPLYNKHSALTLKQCLLEFTGLDVLDEDNKFICQTCTNKNQSEITLCRVSKQILIHKLPPILILQIKRFNIGIHDVTKDNRFVCFPHVLDMSPYCTTQCFEKLGDLNGKILYGLYAVVVHSGSLHGGHYTAYVRQRPVLTDQSAANQIAHPVNAAYDQKRVYDIKAADDGEWYYTSDSHVSRCRFSEVQRCQAYLLFYEMLPLVYI